MKIIDMTELKPFFDHLSKEELILDVRTEEEYAEGHVPGAMNISHEEVLGSVDELKKYNHIYIYCKAGGRAQVAAQMLNMSGIKNLTIITQSGMYDWEEAGFPVAK